MKPEQIEGRNPVVEALERGRRRVRRIWLDQGAKPDRRISRLLELAQKMNVPVAKVHRSQIDARCEGRVHQGVLAEADPLPEWTARELLEHAFEADPGPPLIVLADQIQYEQNLGAILRSSLGFGVSGVVVPTRRGATMSPVVQRVSMGGAEAVPVVRESLFSALKPMKKAGFRVLGADMGGEPLGRADLTGPVAFVMGSEGKGLSPTLRKQCDGIVSIPLAGGLESLNVSVATALLLYEKRRQDGWFPAGA